MSLLFSSHLSASALASVFNLALYFTAGVGSGLLYFHALWWNARLFTSGASAIIAVAFGFARFALLAGLLAFASREGASPLLAMALGVLAARPLVMRSVQRARS